MTDNSYSALKHEQSCVQIPPYILIFNFYIVYNIPISLCFFIPTKVKNAMINILCTIFTYKDEGGSCVSAQRSSLNLYL